MKFGKSELVSAIQLVLLLCLLFWSFTWNSFSFSGRYTYDSEVRQTPESTRGSVSHALENQHTVLVETFSSVKYATSRVASSSRESIPPFKEWKAKEMTKHEKSSNDVIPKQQNKLSRRKLNYASSKCGAKILASNPEAKHRIAILSEKTDEYMLNPCRVRTWFIIELCDTVEATQVELANYELYSSTPKLFSAFWSETYPALIWNFLGTFEGKDQRTMQTFDLSLKNLVKFIKVVIFSHHGKEHYCPLSVFRVLGYSMVQKFEDMESAANIPSTGINPKSATQEVKDAASEKQLNIYQARRSENFGNLTSNSCCPDICTLFLNHCFHSADEIYKNGCVQNPVCHFLNAILPKIKSVCFKCINISIKIDKFIDKNKTNASAYHENKSSNGSDERNSNFSEFYETSKDDTIKKSHKMKDKDNSFVSTIVKDANALKRNSSNVNSSKNDEKFVNNTKKEFSKLEKNYEQNSNLNLKKCILEDNVLKTETLIPDEEASYDKRNLQTSLEDGNSVDSAGLLQKESVLIKLTSRIKASELELDLINKYLQQLSQAYRHQMEDMQTLFNHTVQAISVASEKAAAIDNKQQEDINILDSRINSLNQTLEYFICGQRDMLKRVMELHGFFLILEIIIISTIFTLFLNIFNRKNTHYFGIEKKSFIRLSL